MAAPDLCDCLIVGAGPAGAALAWLLARDGHRVVLVDGGRPRWSGPVETLLGSGLAALQRAGFAELLAAAAAADPLRHGALWAGPELVWQPPAAPGLLLRRGPFDRALQAAAAAAGAELVVPAQVRGDLAAAATAGVQLVTAAGERHLRATAVAVATGRRVPPALLATAVVAQGEPTQAVTAVGEPDPADRGSAVVEAVEQGWLWLHAPPEGPASVAVVGQGGARLPVAAMLAAARGPAGRLRALRLRFATDATPRRRTAPAAAPVLLLGDAAATVDPLASQGVEKAFAAAEHAAAVVRTWLAEPALAPALLAVHRRWEHGLAAAHAATAARFHAEVERFAAAPFWRARRASPVPAAPPPATAVVQTAAAVQFAPVLRRAGRGFAAAPGAHCGDEAVSHLGPVPVLPLLQRARSPLPLGELLRAAGADPQCYVLGPAAVWQALQELWRRGFLSPATSATGSR